ncbi:ABC transporter permease [Pseudactinotalea sp. HY160]|uniref:ABC transporter permease n=1 Tax=Pseudactinotalea sp. HY160 TaxID=2654490 RepID=UPI00128CC337|nr:ABC transporter permease [Pseudactinotalea sp. HY160]MPV48689.1 ABC transporter permease [Pseudactinotalea sp. HY160]
MSTMSAVGRVALREMRTRFTAKATIISTVILMVLIIGAIVALSIITSRPATSLEVGVAGETAELSASLEQAATSQSSSLDLHTGLSAEEGRRQVLGGEIEAFISGDPTAPQVAFDGDPDQTIMELVSAAVRSHALAEAISAAGGDPKQVLAQAATAAPTTVNLSAEQAVADLNPIQIITTLATISLLLFALIQSASMVAVGVVEEKSSRVVEILLATIRPIQLLTGKVIGVGVVALSQVVAMIAAALITAKATGVLDGFEFDLGGAIGMLALWFLLGFAIYVVLVGGLAALVSRQEDIGAVTTPMVFGMMIPFYLGIYLVPNAPDSLATRVLSQVPFFSPFMMPVRTATGVVETWEVLLSVALCLLFIPFLMWIGGRVYGRAVLNTGGRMKLSAALKG